MTYNTLQPATYEQALEAATRRVVRRLARQEGKKPRYGLSQKPRKPLGFSGRKGKPLRARVPRKVKTVDGDAAKDIKRDCDQLVREIIKLRDCSCVTCNLPGNLHVGHLFRRGLESVRWNLLNCNAQCDPCNAIHEEHPLHYQAWFRFHYGNAAYCALEIASRSARKFTYIELLEIRDELRAKLKRLARRQAA